MDTSLADGMHQQHSSDYASSGLMMDPSAGWLHHDAVYSHQAELMGWPPTDHHHQHLLGSHDCGPAIPDQSMMQQGQEEHKAQAMNKSLEAHHYDKHADASFGQMVTPSVGSDAAGMHTTVMLRNLPAGFSRSMLLDLLDSQGFRGTYDFVYLPIDFSSGSSLGYAFINLVSPNEAAPFFQHFSSFSQWPVPSDSVCSMSWSEPHQGLAQYVERYRSSPVMHSSVPDEWKPIILQDGLRIPFPPPTKHIKAPKIRSRPGANRSQQQQL